MATLELNGFEIRGSSVGGAVSIQSDHAEVRNGTVTGFAIGIGVGQESGVGINGVRIRGIRAVGNVGTGIAMAGSGGVVAECLVRDNGGNGLRFWGIAPSDSFLAHENLIESNGRFGLEATNGAAVSMFSNVIKNNTSGDVSANFGGAILELGPNQCGNDTTCP